MHNCRRCQDGKRPEGDDCRVRKVVSHRAGKGGAIAGASGCEPDLSRDDGRRKADIKEENVGVLRAPQDGRAPVGTPWKLSGQ